MVDWGGAFVSHPALKAHLPYEPFPLQNGPFTKAQRRIVIEKNLETVPSSPPLSGVMCEQV